MLSKQDRLVVLRVAMEKMKPLDKKLKYQIDKIVKLASSSESQDVDADEMQFKPNPANLRPKVCACACVCAYVHMCAYVCVHVRMCACTCACANTCVHACASSTRPHLLVSCSLSQIGGDKGAAAAGDGNDRHAASDSGEDSDDDGISSSSSKRERAGKLPSSSSAGTEATGVYRPPKIAAMPYTDDDPAAVRQEKQKARVRARTAWFAKGLCARARVCVCVCVYARTCVCVWVGGHFYSHTYAHCLFSFLSPPLSLSLRLAHDRSDGV